MNRARSDSSTTTRDGAAAFSAAGQLRFASGFLYGSTDADPLAEFALQLAGVSSLAATDLLL